MTAIDERPASTDGDDGAGGRRTLAAYIAREGIDPEAARVALAPHLARLVAEDLSIADQPDDYYILTGDEAYRLGHVVLAGATPRPGVGLPQLEPDWHERYDDRLDEDRSILVHRVDEFARADLYAVRGARSARLAPASWRVQHRARAARPPGAAAHAQPAGVVGGGDHRPERVLRRGQRGARRRNRERHGSDARPGGPGGLRRRADRSRGQTQRARVVSALTDDADQDVTEELVEVFTSLEPGGSAQGAAAGARLPHRAAGRRLPAHTTSRL